MAISEFWWHNAVIYQVYPRSFYDTDGDGIGDLPGITTRLDYLADLGVNALWISPIFQSPMRDFGYDVSDYTAIDPMFGTLEDFDVLLAEAHALGIRILLDLVPNHTSDQHAWFQQSRASRSNPKRDWYIWRDAQADGSPPNNWLSYFGGAAWTWDAASAQYYLHNFHTSQPDLNYRHPAVKQAMFEQISFWLARGVDGFRIDVIERMMKDPQFRDNPLSPDYVAGRDNPMYSQQRVHSENGEGIHELIAEFRQVFDEFGERGTGRERLMVGEILYTADAEKMASFFGTPEQPEMQMPFDFALLIVPFEAEALRRFLDQYNGVMPLEGRNYVLGNHDQPRVATRIGRERARAAAMMLFTLPGTAFIYQGEELGLPDAEIAPADYQDPQGIQTGVSRDGCRAPMPWSPDPNAGFTTGSPWLPIPPEYAAFSVELQKYDPQSSLTLYQRLILLREESLALYNGRFRTLDAPEGVLLYERVSDAVGQAETGEHYLIALNFGDAPRTLDLAQAGAHGELLLSTGLDRKGEIALDSVALHPGEGVIIWVT